MKVTAEQLRQHYSSVETEKLAQYLVEGGLTDEARSLLKEELRRRDSKEIDIAFQAAAADQDTQKKQQASNEIIMARLVRFILRLFFLQR